MVPNPQLPRGPSFHGDTPTAPLMTTTTSDDIEIGAVERKEEAANQGHEIQVTGLESYPGNDLGEKIESVIDLHSVLIISKSTCPFCRDVKDLLINRIGVTAHVIDVNLHPEGGKIFAYSKQKTGRATVPLVFVRGEFIGGCDDTKALHHKGKLEPMLKGLIKTSRVIGTERIETAKLVPPERGIAMNPPFWFPNVVNNYVIRVVGFQTCALSVLVCVFYDEEWAHWLTAFVFMDFVLRLLAGSAASPLGMIATFLTSPFRPQFRPGPPKQFAALCGCMFSGLGTLFYFLNFEHHEWVGLAFMAGLAGASGLEWAFDFCLGCKFFQIGIYLGLIPDYSYRVYTSSRQETEDSWDYMFLNSNAPKPEAYVADPSSKISLRYKRKVDEFTKDDFDFIRHMQIGYFVMPLSLAGLAVAFKVASEWSNDIANALGVTEREIIVDDAAFQAIAVLAALVFVVFLFLYALRLCTNFHKCVTEWRHPIIGNSFAMIPLCMMLFSFLLYDQIEYDQVDASTGEEEASQIIARVFFWIGAITQVLMTMAKFGEWMGRRLEMEHVSALWIIFPVGLSVAALVAPVVPLFAADNQNHDEGTILIARFFQSFALFMFVVLFTITFFKTVTSHNSDVRSRYEIFIWVAAPAVLGMSDFTVCFYSKSPLDKNECADSFLNYFFVALFIFGGVLYSAMPWIGFLGKDKWGMHYWLGVFAIDALAGAACLFYSVTGYRAAQNLSIVALCMAVVANLTNLLAFGSALIRRRGVFTPMDKWGPLAFMKLTHEAFRGNMSTMRETLDNLDLNSKEMQENLRMFAVHLNRFSILHEEHSRHEDDIIFKEFNNWFHEHARKYNDDHTDFHATMADAEKNANILLDVSAPEATRKEALETLRKILPPFFEHFEEHLKGEEDNLNPIGKKHLPIAIQKDISRRVWEITSADRWEIIIPYIIENLPRHPQRIRYLKVLLWSMPERAHQIGAILYRNVDAVMWERLRDEVPEIVPRGESGYWRYY